MADKEAVAALTAERDGLNTKVAALTTENTGLNKQVADLTSKNTELVSKVAGFEKEKSEAALAADKGKHAELLQAALTDGRLTPAQKPWAEKQSLAALTEYLDSTNPLALLNKQTNGGKGGEGSHGLSTVELAECTKMGVSPEDFAKTKAQKK
jgi:phage I-like protein